MKRFDLWDLGIVISWAGLLWVISTVSPMVSLASLFGSLMLVCMKGARRSLRRPAE